MDENVVPLKPDGGSEGELRWTRSSLSRSGGAGVEITYLPDGEIGVRNPADHTGAVLKFTQGEWDAFIGGVENGEFDHFGK